MLCLSRTRPVICLLKMAAVSRPLNGLPELVGTNSRPMLVDGTPVKYRLHGIINVCAGHPSVTFT